MGEVKVTVSSNQPKSVNVKSNTVQHPITATPDLSQYYSNIAGNYADLAKDWAIKLDEAVEGNEYSAKYNAQRASNYKDEAQNISNTMTQNYSVYNSNLLSTKDSAVESINTNKTNAISEINSTKTSAVAEITTAESGAINAINTNKNSVISEINSAGKSYDNLTKSQITNCLLEVPQRIKLELNNGVLTLKAGSVVIIDGKDYTIPSVPTVNTGTGTNKGFFYYEKSRNMILFGRCGSGNSLPADNSQYDLFYNTSDGKVYRWLSSRWTSDAGYSLPLMVATRTSVANQIASIEQVFNGFGYIGNMVWVDKGVKGLIPDGRNEDGTLKNIEYTTSALKFTTFSNAYSWILDIYSNGNVGSYDKANYKVSSTAPQNIANYTLWFDTKNNIHKYTENAGETWFETRLFVFGNGASTTNGVVSSVDFYTTYQGAEKHEVDSKVSKTGDTMTGDLWINKTAGAFAIEGTGWKSFYAKSPDLDITNIQAVETQGARIISSDKNGAWFAGYQSSVNSSGQVVNQFLARRYVNGTAKSSGVLHYLDANGNEFFQFPRCTTKATTTSSASNSKVAVVVQNYLNGSSWYRVWSDGWIEQGGAVTNNNTAGSYQSVKFVKQFTNTPAFISYNIQINGASIATNIGAETPTADNVTTTGMNLFTIASDTKHYVRAGRWYACGY